MEMRALAARVLVVLVVLALSCAGGFPAVEGAVEVKAPEEPAVYYRRQPFDEYVRTVPTELREGLRTRPGAHLQALADYLVQDAEDDFHKVKRIHDWMADNIAYDFEAYLDPEVFPSVGVEAVVARGKSVCAGYAALFKRLCGLAGIEARLISGQSRGGPYMIFSPPPLGAINHSWNAVRLQGRWYLVDSTWGAGYANAARTSWEKNYRTGFLFAPPEEFIYSHLPENEQWQLLESPVVPADFRDLPRLLLPFFEFDIRPAFEWQRLTRVSGAARVRFTVPKGTTMMFRLRRPGGNERLKVPHEMSHGVVRAKVEFPGPGQWILELYAARGGVRRSYKCLGELAYEVAVASGEAPPVDKD